MTVEVLRACNEAQVCAVMKVVTARLMAHRTDHSTTGTLTRRALGVAFSEFRSDSTGEEVHGKLYESAMNACITRVLHWHCPN